MPEQDKSKTVAEPVKETPGGTPEPVDFEKWLAEQTEEVRKAYEAHTTGLKSALASERDARKRLEKERQDAEAQRAAAEAKQLAEQGQYKELAEKTQAKAAELEKQLAAAAPMAERVKALEAVIGRYLDKEKEGVPKHILALLENQPPEKQLEYLTANREVLRAASTPGGGPPATPRPVCDAGKMSEEEKRRRTWRPLSL